MRTICDCCEEPVDGMVVRVENGAAAYTICDVCFRLDKLALIHIEERIAARLPSGEQSR